MRHKDTYTVKWIDHPLLSWAIYRITPVEGHEPVKNLAALAIDQGLAQRIADILSGDDDQVEHLDDLDVEAGAP